MPYNCESTRRPAENDLLFKTAKRIVIFIVGVSILLIGIALTVLPGPAIVVVPLGLAILATEFAWARYWLRKYKKASVSVFEGVRACIWGKRPPVPPEQLTSGESPR